MIIFKELSYKIVGLLFEVSKTLGGAYQEKYYQRAIEKLLFKNKIPFEREFKVDVMFGSDIIGKHYIDFVIDKKIVLEIKKGNKFRMGDIKQVLMYLKSTNYKLGILAYFGNSGVRAKRVVNSSCRKVIQFSES